YRTLSRAAFAEELVARHSTVMDRYDPHRKVGLVFDEWGTWWNVEPGTNPGFLYQQNTVRDALVASIHFDGLHRHADRLLMANIAQTVNVLQAMILTDPETRSEEHTSELQSRFDLVCRLLLEKKNHNVQHIVHDGIFASILDTSMGMTLCSTGYDVVTPLDMDIHYLNAASVGNISCIGHIIQH